MAPLKFSSQIWDDAVRAEKTNTMDKIGKRKRDDIEKTDLRKDEENMGFCAGNWDVEIGRLRYGKKPQPFSMITVKGYDLAKKMHLSAQHLPSPLVIS